MINESINPFDDPIFKKAILDKENKSKNKNSFNLITPGTSFEEVPDLTTQHPDLNSIITSAPTLPEAAKNVVMDASAVCQAQKDEQARAVNMALSEVITKYNQEYGTDLQIDFSNLSKTLVDVADPKSRRVLELYASEVFKTIKPILQLHLISKLTQAMDYVLQPERMFDQSQLSVPDLFLVIEKLQEYIINLNEIISQSTVKDSDQILKKIADESQSSGVDSKETERILSNFLDSYRIDTNNKVLGE